MPAPTRPPIVQAGGTMQSREPFDLAQMLERMSKTIDLVTATIVEVEGRLEDALTSVTATANAAQDLMNDMAATHGRSWPRRRK